LRESSSSFQLEIGLAECLPYVGRQNMLIEVEYTAQLRVKAGISSEQFELQDGASVADLLEAVAGRHDIKEFLNGSLLCFVGAAQAEASQSLSDGDHVTLLTPISGG